MENYKKVGRYFDNLTIDDKIEIFLYLRNNIVDLDANKDKGDYFLCIGIQRFVCNKLNISQEDYNIWKSYIAEEYNYSYNAGFIIFRKLGLIKLAKKYYNYTDNKCNFKYDSILFKNNHTRYLFINAVIIYLNKLRVK